MNEETLERRENDRLLHDKLDKHIEHEEGRLKKIEDDVAEIKSSIKGLLDAWNAANTIGNFLKWIASIAAGVVIVIEAVKHFGGK